MQEILDSDYLILSTPTSWNSLSELLLLLYVECGEVGERRWVHS